MIPLEQKTKIENTARISPAELEAASNIKDSDIYRVLFNCAITDPDTPVDYGKLMAGEEATLDLTDKDPVIDLTSSQQPEVSPGQGSLLSTPGVDRRNPKAARVRGLFDDLSKTLENPILSRWKTEVDTIYELAREIDLSDRHAVAELASELARVQKRVSLITSELEHRSTNVKPHDTEKEPTRKMIVTRERVGWLHADATEIALEKVQTPGARPYLFGDIIDDSHLTRKVADQFRPSQVKAAIKAIKTQIGTSQANPFSTNGLRKLERCDTTEHTRLNAYKAEINVPDIDGCRALVLNTKNTAGDNIYLLAALGQHDDQVRVIYGL